MLVADCVITVAAAFVNQTLISHRLQVHIAWKSLRNTHLTYYKLFMINFLNTFLLCISLTAWKVFASKYRNSRARECLLTRSLVAATVGVAINKAWTALLWELSAGLEYISHQSDGLDDSTCCVNYRKAQRQPSPAPYAAFMCVESQRLNLISKPPLRIHRLVFNEVQTHSSFLSISTSCPSIIWFWRQTATAMFPTLETIWLDRLQEVLGSPMQWNHEGNE